MSQAAGLTGVSERQIQHWMDKGYIDHARDGGRKVSGETLDRILLIKQARDAGVPLRQAVPMARAYLQSEMMGDLQSEMAHSVLRDLRERLRVASESIASLDEILTEAISPDGKVLDSSLPTATGDRVSSRRSG